MRKNKGLGYNVFLKLIHSANPKSRQVVIIAFAHFVRPSVPTFEL